MTERSRNTVWRLSETEISYRPHDYWLSYRTRRRRNLRAEVRMVGDGGSRTILSALVYFQIPATKSKYQKRPAVWASPCGSRSTCWDGSFVGLLPKCLRWGLSCNRFWTFDMAETLLVELLPWVQQDCLFGCVSFVMFWYQLLLISWNKLGRASFGSIFWRNLADTGAISSSDGFSSFERICQGNYFA